MSAYGYGLLAAKLVADAYVIVSNPDVVISFNYADIVNAPVETRYVLANLMGTYNRFGGIQCNFLVHVAVV